MHPERLHLLRNILQRPVVHGSAFPYSADAGGARLGWISGTPMVPSSTAEFKRSRPVPLPLISVP